MFQQNVEFRVTIRDFLDRCEPQVLKNAGPMFLRAIREASADYLENALDPDAELRWTVTLHQKLGVGTIHYAVFREDVGFEGKCLTYDLKTGPVPNRPWTPIEMKRGELFSDILPVNTAAEEDEYAQVLKGVVQPKHQDFFSYYFRGWMPAARVTADMFEEEFRRTMIGVGFSADFVDGKSQPTSPYHHRNLLIAHHQLYVTKSIGEKDPTGIKAARTYEVDARPAKGTIAVRINFLKIDEKNEGREELIEAVIQEGGWLPGIYVKDPKMLQFSDIYTWTDYYSG